MVTANQIMQQNRREPVSQATTVEQSRAVAEVQAAVIVAQNRPRNEAQAMAKAMGVPAVAVETADALYRELKASVGEPGPKLIEVRL